MSDSTSASSRPAALPDTSESTRFQMGDLLRFEKMLTPRLARIGVRALLVAASLAVLGCDSSDSAADDRTSLIPLEEGNEWVMSEDGPVSQEGQTITLRIAGETTIRDATYREVDYSDSESFSITGALVVRTINDGLYIARPRPTNAGIQLYGFELRSSVSDGDTYVHTDERGNSYEVSVSEQTISAPAGTFDVLVYRATRESNGNTDVAFIARGIGPVQLDFRGEIYRLLSTNVQ